MILLLSNNTFSLNVTKFTSNSYLYQNINVDSARHFFPLSFLRSSTVGWRVRGGRWEAEKEANLHGMDQKMYEFNILLTGLYISVSAKVVSKGALAVTTPQRAAEKEEATRAQEH